MTSLGFSALFTSCACRGSLSNSSSKVVISSGALFGNPGPFFVYQQFSLGGVQYGEQLRGYEEFSISPVGYLGESTDQFNASRFFDDLAARKARVSSAVGKTPIVSR